MNEKKTQIYCWNKKQGITRTKEFEKKGLATHAVNPGLACDHDCAYCSTKTMLRTHPAFKVLGLNPFGSGYAIVDPTTPEIVAQDALHLKKRGLIQLSTIVDAWSPAAQKHNLGRRCLEAILAQPGWTVRILTKNAAIVHDFDLIEQFKDRVLVGLSLTAPPEKEKIQSLIEPNASTISERMGALRIAHAKNLRTYGMLCPLLPSIADDFESIDTLVKFVSDCGAEEIFAEPVNPRGKGLKLIQQTLTDHGYSTEAAAIEKIRHRVHWSKYVADLVGNVQASVRRYSDISKLRFLLYPKNLTDADRKRIEQDDAGVVWLGKE
jgi:DNA repair photolyase